MQIKGLQRDCYIGVTVKIHKNHAVEETRHKEQLYIPFGGVPRRVHLTHRELSDLGLRALAKPLMTYCLVEAGGAYYQPVAGTRVGVELGANEPLTSATPLVDAWGDQTHKGESHVFSSYAKHYARETAERYDKHIGRMAAGRQGLTKSSSKEKLNYAPATSLTNSSSKEKLNYAPATSLMKSSSKEKLKDAPATIDRYPAPPPSKAKARLPKAKKRASAPAAMAANSNIVAPPSSPALSEEEDDQDEVEDSEENENEDEEAAEEKGEDRDEEGGAEDEW